MIVTGIGIVMRDPSCSRSRAASEAAIGGLHPYSFISVNIPAPDEREWKYYDGGPRSTSTRHHEAYFQTLLMSKVAARAVPLPSTYSNF